MMTIDLNKRVKFVLVNGTGYANLEDILGILNWNQDRYPELIGLKVHLVNEFRKTRITNG